MPDDQIPGQLGFMQALDDGGADHDALEEWAVALAERFVFAPALIVPIRVPPADHPSKTDQ